MTKAEIHRAIAELVAAVENNERRGYVDFLMLSSPEALLKGIRQRVSDTDARLRKVQLQYGDVWRELQMKRQDSLTAVFKEKFSKLFARRRV